MPASTSTVLGAAALVLGSSLAALAAALGYRAWKRKRVLPEERERRRRAALATTGKIADATLVDIREDVLFYSYLVRGVEYTASQEITLLKGMMPSGLGLGIGAVSVKYDPRNAANSIVLSESWSGLHAVKGAATASELGSASDNSEGA